ncbi:MAG: DMT family transporter [Actinobacteria bacterium]|jgi:drug/metabolite transporter (DMT)-like permease|nr:MAG: DMT family transporter [Actinomycetota bacterium]
MLMPGRIDFLTRARQAELSLIAITIIWGLTFSMVKETLEVMPPFVFMSYRFALAFLVMAAVCGKRVARIDRGTIAAGLLLGVFLYGAYSFQTFGLQYTTAGNAGFITGLFVVFVPILSTVVLRKKPGRRSVFSVIVATIGLGLLSLQPGLKVNSGDILVLACAFTYSLHIIYMDRFVQRYDLMLLTLLQMGVVAVLQTGSALIFEDFVLPTGAYAWLTIVVCGVFASALAFFVQAWAQREISPVRTSVVLIMEPVFSVFFGIILLGETLTWRGWLGCALMLAGMLITEIKPESRSRGDKWPGG